MPSDVFLWMKVIGAVGITSLIQVTAVSKAYSFVNSGKITEVITKSNTATSRQIPQVYVVQTKKLNGAEYLQQGTKKYNEQDFQGALADYNRAIQLDPTLALAYDNRGYIKAEKLQDFRGALTDYNRAIQLDSTLAAAHNKRGLLKASKLQDYRGALADYNRAIQLDPNYAAAYSSRGSLKVTKFKDFQGGLTDLDQAIKLDSNIANAYAFRAEIKHNHLKDRAGAITDMQQAANLFQRQGSINQYERASALLKKWQ